MFFEGRSPRVETLGYDWEEAVKRCALVYESGLKSARQQGCLYYGGLVKRESLSLSENEVR